eukprot:3013455-Rhodomonas_salina.2
MRNQTQKDTCSEHSLSGNHGWSRLTLELVRAAVFREQHWGRPRPAVASNGHRHVRPPEIKRLDLKSASRTLDLESEI